MLREMQEIQALATKYSKADLGRMVQLGLLDPQKAMMAGMMIQRIEQQNAKPPQTTVAQELLGLPVVPNQPPQQPQMPPQGAPAPQAPMMAASGGVTSIPADNVGNYAGGGIVAFDEGGEVPGFAAGIPPGLFDALVKAESGGQQSAISSKGARGAAQLMPGTMRDPGYGIKPVRDDSEAENRRVGQEYLSAMLRKYKGNIDNALAAYNWGPGNVDKHLKKYGELTPEKLPKETRNYIPKVKNFLAQQEPRRPEPTRVAARETTDGAMDMPALRSRSGVPSLLRGPLERVANLLPSAGAEEMSMIPMDAPAGSAYAGGGIASFRDGGLGVPVDLQTPFDTSGGNQTVYGTTTTDVFRPTSEAEPTSSVFGRALSSVFESPAGARERYSAQQDALERQRALRMRLQQLEGYGFAQQTRAQQAEAEQIRKELSALEGQLRTAARTQTAPPPPPSPQSAAPAGGIRAQPPQTQAYPVKGGFETVAPDQFPLQSATEMGARRREGFAPAQNLPPVAGAPEAGAGAGTGAGPTPTMPELKGPKTSTTSFEDYVKKVTPKVGKLDIPEVKDLKDVGKERREAYAAEGYDPDMFNKIIKGIEEKKGKAATEKDVALGEGIMYAGLKLMGARKGQEFQTLSEGAQEGLKNYQSAMKDVRARQEKYDERIEQLRMADATARRTGVDADIARRDKLEEKAQAAKIALFNAENAAANTGIQAATSMNIADQNRLLQEYQIETSARMQKYVADTQLKIQSEVNNMYKMGMLEANQAKIVMDAAGKFVASNKDNPAYVKDPARLEEDAIAYAYRMAGNLGILPKGATIPEPAKPTEQDYMNRYKIPPVK